MRQLIATLVSVPLATLALMSAGLQVGGAPSASGAIRAPGSIAAIGDSITQAFDVCCSYGSHPANSWSTGDASGDGVASHYERLLALNPGIAGHNHNDAISGADMADAAAQAQAAVAQRARYVTILMGANDLCTSSPATMTSVADFRSEFQDALRILAAGLPAHKHVFVASIPDLYQLWSLYHTDPAAELVWSIAGICQSLLAPTRTEDERRAVRSRDIAFNGVLQQECAVYSWCRFDQGAVFDFQFARSDVSKLDYFHPSLTGQADLARVTWQRSWWS
jgi:lysophospholipase L1-like esterase